MTHLFVLDLEYIVGLEEVDRCMAGHQDYLDRNYAAGTFLASGRKDPRTGGVILAHGDRDAIDRVVSSDPFHQRGVARYTVTEFVPSRTTGELHQWRETPSN